MCFVLSIFLRFIVNTKILQHIITWQTKTLWPPPPHGTCQHIFSLSIIWNINKRIAQWNAFFKTIDSYLNALQSSSTVALGNSLISNKTIEKPFKYYKLKHLNYKSQTLWCSTFSYHKWPFQCGISLFSPFRLSAKQRSFLSFFLSFFNQNRDLSFTYSNFPSQKTFTVLLAVVRCSIKITKSISRSLHL